MHQEVQKALRLKYPDITHIQLTKNVSVNGVNYREGMIVVHGDAGGLHVLPVLGGFPPTVKRYAG